MLYLKITIFAKKMGKSCSIGTIFWFIILISCGAGWLGWILFFTAAAVSVAVIMISSYIKDKKNMRNGRDFLDWQEVEADRPEADPEAYKKGVGMFKEKFGRRHKS